MEGPKVRLVFEASELIALAELAKKWNTDIGSILRMGGRVILNAERQGLIKINDPNETVRMLSQNAPRVAP